jgi:hypothetical protein
MKTEVVHVRVVFIVWERYEIPIDGLERVGNPALDSIV